MNHISKTKKGIFALVSKTALLKYMSSTECIMNHIVKNWKLKIKTENCEVFDHIDVR